MQWSSSSITLNPPPQLANIFSSSLSVSDWVPNLFSKPFEYYAIIQSLSSVLIEYNLSALNFTQGQMLLNFNCLFNGVVASNAIIYPKNSSMTDLYDKVFQGLQPYVLSTYIRYIVLEFFMGGFYQTRNANDLLFGYVDPLLVQISQLDPLSGGDPSVSTIVALAGNNMTYDDALQTPVSMYTGADNTDMVRMYHSVLGANYIAMEMQAFNGNYTYSYVASPWAENIPIYGTDSDINKPGLSESYNPPVYISDIYYQTNLSYSGENPVYNGVNAIRYRMSQASQLNCSQNPVNCLFYCNKYNGLINMSSVQKAPVFFSQNYFYNADPVIQNAVQIYLDSAHTQLAVPTIADDTYVDLEPYTGVNLGTTVRLQLNYEFAQDDLFSTSTVAMLPIYTLQRGTNFTDDQVDTVFGQLKTGLQIVSIGPIVCYILSGLMIVISVLSFKRFRRLKQEKEFFSPDNSFEVDEMRRKLRDSQRGEKNLDDEVQ